MWHEHDDDVVWLEIKYDSIFYMRCKVSCSLFIRQIDRRERELVCICTTIPSTSSSSTLNVQAGQAKAIYVPLKWQAATRWKWFNIWMWIIRWEQINGGLSVERLKIIYKEMMPSKNTLVYTVAVCVCVWACSINHTLSIYILTKDAKCKILFVMNQNQAIKSTAEGKNSGQCTGHMDGCGLLTNGRKNSLILKDAAHSNI